jgi:hypothetical protein
MDTERHIYSKYFMKSGEIWLTMSITAGPGNLWLVSIDDGDDIREWTTINFADCRQAAQDIIKWVKSTLAFTPEDLPLMTEIYAIEQKVKLKPIAFSEMAFSLNDTALVLSLYPGANDDETTWMIEIFCQGIPENYFFINFRYALTIIANWADNYTRFSDQDNENRTFGIYEAYKKLLAKLPQPK